MKAFCSAPYDELSYVKVLLLQMKVALRLRKTALVYIDFKLIRK